mmetsp:Transcript_31506/g.57244  ORF Transcript_31506/g.57244 Transcript_31506/m.57244 type:complete len:291 (-) Transcript_31506:1259-2131(-)
MSGSYEKLAGLPGSSTMSSLLLSLEGASSPESKSEVRLGGLSDSLSLFALLESSDFPDLPESESDSTPPAFCSRAMRPFIKACRISVALIPASSASSLSSFTLSCSPRLAAPSIRAKSTVTEIVWGLNPASIAAALSTSTLVSLPRSAALARFFIRASRCFLVASRLLRSWWASPPANSSNRRCASFTSLSNLAFSAISRHFTNLTWFPLDSFMRSRTARLSSLFLFPRSARYLETRVISSAQASRSTYRSISCSSPSLNLSLSIIRRISSFLSFSLASASRISAACLSS